MLRDQLRKDISQKLALRESTKPEFRDTEQKNGKRAAFEGALPMDLDFKSLSQNTELVSKLFKKMLRKVSKNSLYFRKAGISYR